MHLIWDLDANICWTAVDYLHTSAICSILTKSEYLKVNKYSQHWFSAYISPYIDLVFYFLLIFWSFGTMEFNIELETESRQPKARRRKGCRIFQGLSWTVSIKPSLRFSNFGCCISKGFPIQICLEVDVQLYEYSIASFCLVLFKQSKFTKCVSFFLVQDFEWFQCKTCSD